VSTEQVDIQQNNTTLQKFSFLREYPVLKNEHTATQNSTMTIPATPKNQISGSQNHGDSLMRQYQIIQLDFLPSGTVTDNTQETDVRN
jgi:hypothetical protein